MQYITEFTPVELIIIDEAINIPDHYLTLLEPYRLNKILDDNIRIIHWEWYYDGDYQLIIDITINPGKKEYGIICLHDKIIYENKNQKLIIKDKHSPLFSRHADFQHVRKVNDDCSHMHCISTRNVIQELHEDLLEEDVSEEEYNKLTEPYIHYSSDDASGLSSEDEPITYEYH